MNESIKNRLVGIIVLGALAVVFLPMLLDGEGIRPPRLDSKIPPAPEIPEVPEITQTRPPLASRDSAAAEPNAETETESAAAGLDAQGLPAAWSVRLGTFSESDNAEKLVQDLRQQGYKAYLTRMQGDNSVLNVVYVGPVLSKQEANDLQAELETKVDLKGLVEAFSVDEPK